MSAKNSINQPNRGAALPPSPEGRGFRAVNMMNTVTGCEALSTIFPEIIEAAAPGFLDDYAGTLATASKKAASVISECCREIFRKVGDVLVVEPAKNMCEVKIVPNFSDEVLPYQEYYRSTKKASVAQAVQQVCRMFQLNVLENSKRDDRLRCTISWRPQQAAFLQLMLHGTSTIDRKGVVAEDAERLNLWRKQGEFCDHTFIVGSQHFSVHKNILCAKSEYFRLLFDKKFSESASKEPTRFGEEEFPSEVFESMLDFLYTGFFAPNDLREDHLIALIGLADMLQLSELKELGRLVLSERLRMSNYYDIVTYALSSEDDFLKKVCKRYFDVSTLIDITAMIDFSTSKLEQEDIFRWLDVVAFLEIEDVSRQVQDKLKKELELSNLEAFCAALFRSKVPFRQDLKGCLYDIVQSYQHSLQEDAWASARSEYTKLMTGLANAR